MFIARKEQSKWLREQYHFFFSTNATHDSQIHSSLCMIDMSDVAVAH